MPVEEALHCINCGCEWLELIKLNKYKKNHNIILGQAPPKLPQMTITLHLFKCPKCGTLMEPTTMVGPWDRVHKEYLELLNKLETKAEADKVTASSIDGIRL